MENDTFIIDASNTKVIYKQKEKIERLFDVQLVIFGNEKSDGNEVTGFCNCSVVSKSANAQKNVDKTKVHYLFAVNINSLKHGYSAIPM